EQAQYFCQVWYHRVGDAQSADRVIYHRPDRPEVVFDVDVTSDSRYLVITSRLGASDKAEIHVFDTASIHMVDAGMIESAPFFSAMPLVTGFTDGWHFVGGS